VVIIPKKFVARFFYLFCRLYQDFGTATYNLMYYDQCQTLASQYGASIITPQTIGLSGDNYWIGSTHTCNTFEYFYNFGTAMCNWAFSVNYRSLTRYCMIGYITGCSTPPASCPSQHLSLATTWSPPIVASGACSWGTSPSTYYNLGAMTWKSCLGHATRLGAMLYPNYYFAWGWTSHRQLGPSKKAMYTTSWSSYGTADISTNVACVLARDPNAGTTNDLVPPNTIVYDGDTW